jgi:hypothetical protein
VLLFSLAKLLDYKLGGNALDTQRGKFTSLKCDTQRGQAIMVFTTEPTFSAVRKVLAVVAKNFMPAKLMPLYKKYATMLGTKVSPGEFAWCVDEMVKGVKSLSAFVTGTIRVPESADLEKIVKSIAPEKSDMKSEAPKAAAEPAMAWDEIKCTNSLDAFLLQQFLASLQIESRVREGNVVPITGSQKWETIRGKIDAERVKRFVELKLVKLGAKLPDVLRLMCALTGYFSATDLEKLPANHTPAALVDTIKKHFK